MGRTCRWNPKYQLHLALVVKPHLDTTAVHQPAEQQLVSASARRIVSWMRRCIGRAPIAGSKPSLARCSRNSGVNTTSNVFFMQLVFDCMRNCSTTRMITSRESGLKLIVASSRLRNSGVNSR